MSNCGCCHCSCGCPCHGQPSGGGGGQPGTGGQGGGTGQTGGGGTGGGTLPGPLPQLGTWLLIRYDSADLGARPIPGSDVFWESPDIWLTGGDLFGNPIGGKPTQVFARVWNLGSIAALPVRVDFFFIVVPSLGIPPSAPELIGTAWTSVLPMSATNVPCPTPWIPPVAKGNLHSCLLATCSAPLQNDVPTVPANPVADRHTGQHNLTVIEVASAAVHVRLNLVNLAPISSAIQLMAAASWRPEPSVPAKGFPARPSLIGPVNAVQSAAESAYYRLWAQRASLIIERSAHTSDRSVSAGRLHEIVKLTELRPGHTKRSAAVVPPPNRFDTAASLFTNVGDAIELDPLQEATASLSITMPPQRQQPWFIVHLAQAANGSVVGGYTVVIRAA